MRQQWSGDVDLNDGELLKQYKAYQSCLKFAEGVGLTGENSDTVSQLHKISDDLSMDLKFLQSGYSIY